MNEEMLKLIAEMGPNATQIVEQYIQYLYFDTLVGGIAVTLVAATIAGFISWGFAKMAQY